MSTADEEKKKVEQAQRDRIKESGDEYPTVYFEKEEGEEETNFYRFKDNISLLDYV